MLKMMEDLCSTRRGDGFSQGLGNFQVMSQIISTSLDSLVLQKVGNPALHHMMVISENTVKELQLPIGVRWLKPPNCSRFYKL